MKTVRLSLVSLVIVVSSFGLIPNVCEAWNDFGHQVVAKIACDTLAKLSPAARAKLDAIVQADPRPMRKDVFVCAIWPDLNKHHNEVPNVPASFFQGAPVEGTWHFVDIPFETTNAQAVADFINMNGVKPDPNHPLHSGDVAIAIRLYTSLLKASLTLTNTGAARDQADYVSWLIHYVGDVHQPLHCVTVTAPLPNYTPPTKGDAGGNGFPISGFGKVTELHAFWDDQLNLVDRVKGAKEDHLNPDLVQITSVASRLESEHPQDSLGQALTQTDPADWAAESHAFCNQVYALTPNQKPSAEYADFAKKTAEERVALAGYRLAALLKSILE